MNTIIYTPKLDLNRAFNQLIIYIPKFVPDPDRAFSRLRDELEWEQRDAPRYEYYCNDFPHPYVYGIGKGQREYHPRPYHELILSIRKEAELVAQKSFNLSSLPSFDVCFLNRYLHGRHHLGWHADDSPEMDDTKPIAVVSLGPDAEREIWFREKIGMRCSCCAAPDLESHKMSCVVFKMTQKNREIWNQTQRTDNGSVRMQPIYGEVQKLRLEHGSLLLMAPGMQDTHQHRIPKAGFECGERISLTYRGYVR